MSRTCLVILFAFIALLPFAAHAETTIAVVDVQALLTKSDAAKSVEKQATAYKEKFLGELSKQEQSLRDAEKKLSEERAKLSKEEFTKKAQEFEKKLLSTREMAQKTKKNYDDASGKALNQLREKIMEVVQQIATEKGYGIVLSKQGVVVAAQSMDITAETMTRLNKAISTLNLDIKDK